MSLDKYLQIGQQKEANAEERVQVHLRSDMEVQENYGGDKDLKKKKKNLKKRGSLSPYGRMTFCCTCEISCLQTYNLVFRVFSPQPSHPLGEMARVGRITG